MLTKISLYLIHHQITHPVRIQRQQPSAKIAAAKAAHILYRNHTHRHSHKGNPIQVFKAYHRTMHLNRLKVVQITFRIVVAVAAAAAAPVSTIPYQR